MAINADQLRQAVETAEVIVSEIADNYTSSFADDATAISVTATIAAMIYCSNIIAKAIYSTGPV